MSRRESPEGDFPTNLNDELLHALRQLGVICGDGAGNSGVAGNLSQLLKHLAYLVVISAGDLQSSVNEDIGAVVVGSEDTGNEAVEALNACNCVVINVDQTYLGVMSVLSAEPF